MSTEEKCGEENENKPFFPSKRQEKEKYPENLLALVHCNSFFGTSSSNTHEHCDILVRIITPRFSCIIL